MMFLQLCAVILLSAVAVISWILVGGAVSDWSADTLDKVGYALFVVSFVAAVTSSAGALAILAGPSW